LEKYLLGIDLKKINMNWRKYISEMKCNSYLEAKKKAISIFNDEKKLIGELVPVGEWILKDSVCIESISSWRQKSMKMFLTQFESTYDKTYVYLKKLSIDEGGRLFFMIYDDANNVIGHIGVSNVDGIQGELDNLMRGSSGGDRRLIYFAEATLLNWCFLNLGIQKFLVYVISYNWIVMNLHTEMGFLIDEKFSLRKFVENETTFHEKVGMFDKNVGYSAIRMNLKKEIFYQTVSLFNKN